MNTFNLDSFFPKEKLQLIKAEQTNDIIHIYLKSKTKSCVCPKCGQSTEEYHGTYVRHVQDLPILGKNVQLHIKAHEYKCTNTDCNASTIAENFNGFLNYYSRMTERCADFICSLALETSCEGCSRICKVLGIKALDELKEKNLLLQRDIMREKQMEQQQLDFFSAVSHELKTPVTVLKGQLQGMLYRVGGYKDRDKYLRRSYEVVNSMDDMIKEILSVARIKSSGFALSRVTIALDKIVQGVIHNLEDIAINKGLQLHIELLEQAGVTVDKALFEKVISNLIGNAIKYTPDNGSVWIRIFREGGNIIFSVENESENIPEAEIPQLFDAFYRRDKSRSRKTGGSGLGLYIVKMILELHGFAYQFYNTEHGVAIKIIFS